MEIFTEEQVESFVRDGFVKLTIGSREQGEAAQALLWKQIGLSPNEPEGWREPVVWAADLTGQGPFGELVRSPALAAGLDAVCGKGGWQPRGAAGNIPIRFPRRPPANDRGWHLDANVPRPDGSWGVTARSHTFLVLMLFSEVGELDAPTRVRAGSQRDSLAALSEQVHGHVSAGAPGEQVYDYVSAGALVDAASQDRPVAPATGLPGDAYLVHPLTVHAAQEHLGERPRFMAQMPFMLTAPLDPTADTPLARALR
ncbi:phytanoyl-CoA dioxygenase [Streptosporangium sp. NBC_01755]|uniref:phytanoyl-CoA dioxygenase n=1 Tax=unclassified Streptosporangium TaxID=2632669 RepID=UPI002DDA9C58|nr:MULTISPECIES: phytanoyl-CoA dioxygenase [unclassified Streptosporangium]WSA26939.1 phytanoyl-CoA dioxygenase [Streptosporangium sp. NBC_01810]WSD01636.1 phytanoyl-CoA dioxygenase [Streptosporangium sp. NBC_01755]